ncbi:MAG: GNAT family N-acetyltransferase [Gaiellaceae bacterium]
MSGKRLAAQWRPVPMLSSVPVVAPDPPLAAGGVVLRVPDEGDAAWITESWNDPDIARFIVEMPSPFTQRWVSGTDAELVIADAASGEPLGLISLRVAERDPALAAIGYWLRAEARGRGAATVAVQLVARWAFDALGVQRLELTTAPDNVASQRVAERVGFTREGVLRGLVATKKNGRRDNVMFSLLPADLAAIAEATPRE